MTTDTPDRDKLSEYPCGDSKWPCSETCPAAQDASDCRSVPVYRAHIALRADMRKLRAAVLGDMTPEKAAQMYRTASKRESGYVNSWGRFNALADVVAKL